VISCSALPLICSRIPCSFLPSVSKITYLASINPSLAHLTPIASSPLLSLDQTSSAASSRTFLLPT
jgi:hypothetical protein